MKVRIEVIGENNDMANDLVEEIACDLFDKFPSAEKDFEKIGKEKTVEIFLKR